MKFIIALFTGTSLLFFAENCFSHTPLSLELNQDNTDSILRVLLDELQTNEMQDQKDTEAFHYGLLILLLTAIGFCSYVLFHYLKNRSIDQKWRKGIFHSGYTLKPDHLVEVYMRLGARMIQNDRKDAGGKLRYMNNYFRRHFPSSGYNFNVVISHAYRNPINIRHVANWVHKYLPQKEQKLQVIYFLTGLASLDGDIGSRESAFLLKIGGLLKLSSTEVESIISMYRGYSDSKRTSDRSQFSTKKKATAREISSKILGVSLNAGIAEIKKAYRSLVKLHHPDRFVNTSKEQQELAHQRFIQIQRAYETLEKLH